MRPVRIKYYGMFWLTLQGYLTLQFFALLVCVILMVIGFSVILRTGHVWPRMPDTRIEDDALFQTLIGLFWLGLVGLFAESLETIVMLRKFRRARLEQQNQLLALNGNAPAPAIPSSTAIQTPPDHSANTNIQP